MPDNTHIKYILDEDEMPEAWYNIVVDLPRPPDPVLLHDEGIIDAQAYYQTSVFEAAIQFTCAEGIIPAPESSHAIRAAINEALEAKEAGQERVILFNLSGHGHFDMAAYDAYFSGKLEDYEYPAEAVAEAQKRLPQVV